MREAFLQVLYLGTTLGRFQCCRKVAIQCLIELCGERVDPGLKVGNAPLETFPLAILGNLLHGNVLGSPATRGANALLDHCRSSKGAHNGYHSGGVEIHYETTPV